jgi:hypothetical protein
MMLHFADANGFGSDPERVEVAASDTSALPAIVEERRDVLAPGQHVPPSLTRENDGGGDGT